VDRGTLSAQAAKRVFAEIAERDDAAAHVAERLGLVQVEDADQLDRWVDQVLETHPAEVARYRSGEAKLLGFFTGQVMKASRGRADPKRVQPILRERLGA
jgi:Asp-tRNA(Asn)/Glu-tRNA(Gln) amidotransferase B subunit